MCFFKTDITVFWLMCSTREVSRMSLPFRDIFIICCLVWGVALLFLYWVWEVFLQELHLRLGVPLVGCLPVFSTFSLLQCMHFTAIFTTLILMIMSTISLIN